MFGFSSGGFTTLAIIGGVPDFTKVGPMCREHPGDFACQLLARHGAPTLATATASAADDRIRAAVVAAPALGFAFAPDGLKNVRVPVQLWRAEQDVVVPHPREAVRLALPEAPDYHVVAAAGHDDFLAPCSTALAALAPAICASAAGFDRSTFHVAFDEAVVRFFKKTLQAPARPGLDRSTSAVSSRRRRRCRSRRPPQRVRHRHRAASRSETTKGSARAS